MDHFLRSLQQRFNNTVRSLKAQAVRWNRSSPTRVIVICPNCSQKLRIPRRRNKLIVTCTVCRHEFSYQYYGLGLSSSSQKPFLVGLAGSLIGFALLEIILASQVLSAAAPLFVSALVIGVFGAFFGAVMGAAEGFFHKDRARLSYGFQTGFLLGLVSGIVSGLIAQQTYAGVLSLTPTGQAPSSGITVLARVTGWAVLGLLLGGSYGIKENTVGDLKYGLIGGALGGAIGGLFFDTFGSLISGSLGRLLGFLTLGIAISVAVSYFQEIGISLGSREMYQQLTPRLPANTRMLPRPGRRT